MLIVEGEKAADAAGERLADHVVVTSPGGSHAASKADWSPVAGRHVAIWPDADEAGTHYANDIAEMARRAGAASVRTATLPAGLPEAWDLADDLPVGVTHADLIGATQDDPDEPIPLFPPLGEPEPFPVGTLGPLASAAKAIANKIRVPLAVAAQSVLAAGALAVQAHADVR